MHRLGPYGIEILIYRNTKISWCSNNTVLKQEKIKTSKCWNIWISEHQEMSMVTWLEQEEYIFWFSTFSLISDSLISPPNSWFWSRSRPWSFPRPRPKPATSFHLKAFDATVNSFFCVALLDFPCLRSCRRMSGRFAILQGYLRE